MVQAALARIRDWHESHDVQLVALTALGEGLEESAETALQTARLLAADHRVMLLDAAGPESPFNPSPEEKGLGNLLKEEIQFADIVHADRQAAHLHLVPWGDADPAEVPLQGELMRHLLEALRENYDLVLLHEGTPRYPLRKNESVLPLAEAVVIFASSAMVGVLDSLKMTLQQSGMQMVAGVTPDTVAVDAVGSGQPADAPAWQRHAS